MKAKLAVLISIVMALAMVAPVAALTSADSSSAEDPPASSPIPEMPEFDTEGLKAILSAFMNGTSKVAEDESVDGNITVNDNEFLILSKNYTFDAGETITVKSGGYLLIEPMQAFSLISTDGFAGILFEKGSSFAVVSGTPESYAKIDEVTAWSKEFTDDPASLYFNGSVVYEPVAGGTMISKSINVNLTVSNGFTLKNAVNDADLNYKMTLSEEAKINLTLRIASETGKVTMKMGLAGKVVANAETNYKENNIHDDASLNLSLSANGNFEVPMDETKVTDLTGKITSEDTLSVSYSSGGVTIPVTVEANASIDVSIPEFSDDLALIQEGSLSFADALKNSEPAFTGTASFKMTVGSFSDFDTNGGKVTVDGFSFSISLELADTESVLTVGLGASKLFVEPDKKKEGYDEKVEINNVNISATVGFATAKEEIPLSAAIDSMYAMIAGQYGNGYAALSEEDFAKLTSEDFNKHASETILGFVNGIVSTFSVPELSRVGVDASVDSVNVVIGGSSNIDLRGIRLGLKIDDANGILLEAGIGYAFVDIINESEFYMKNANVTATNSQTQNKFLDITVSGDFGIRSYSDKVLRTEILVTGVNVMMQTPLDVIKPSIASFGVSGIQYTAYGVGCYFDGISFDVEKQVLKAEKVTIDGDYFGEAPIKHVSGTVFGLESSGTGATMGSLRVSFTDLDGDVLTFEKSYDKEKNTVNATFDSTGPFWVNDASKDTMFTSMLSMKFTEQDPAKEPDKSLAISGQVIYNGANFSPDDCDFTVTGTFFATSEDCFGNVSPSKTNVILPDETTYSMMFVGCALQFVMNDDGTVGSFAVRALPGYSSSGFETTGMTIAEDGTVTIDNKADFGCTAQPAVYEIYIDDECVKDNAKIGEKVTYNVESGVIALVDANGAMVGTVTGSEWSYTRTYGEGALRLTTVKATVVEEVKTGTNNVTGSAITFTVPDLTSASATLVFDNGLRFDLKGSTLSGKTVNMIAKPTTYNGKTAYVVKVLNDNAPVASVFYIPVDSTATKLMHVDEYGRVSTLASDAVTIDGKIYLKASMTDYSILYTEADSPLISPDSGNADYTLIIIGVAIAAIALVGVGAFVFFKRKA